MLPFRHRKTAIWLLGAAFALTLIWLVWFTLPRLLGLAAERWLAIPGVESLRVEVAEVGASRLTLRELRGTYRGTGGDRLEFALNDVAIDFSALRRRVERVDAGRAVLDLHPADTLAHSPWPLLAWPQGAPDKANVRDLQLTLHRPTGTRLAVRGELDVQRADDRIEATLRAPTGRLQLAATTGSTLDVAADWRPDAGAAASAQLRIGARPSGQPASLRASLPLPLVADIARTTGFDLPLTEVRGTVALQATAALGEDGGTLRTLDGEADFVDAGAQAAVSGEPLKPGSASTFSLAGKLRFTWQAQQSTLELQPGLRWQLSSEQANASGQLEQPFALTRTGDAIASTGDLAAALHSAPWGTWDAVVHDLRLDTGTALGDVKTAAARLRIKGTLPRWQHGNFALRTLRATGDATLNWSPDQGFSAKLAAQLTPERLTLAGALPLAIAQSTWKATASAHSKPQADFRQNFTVHGEASSEQLHGEHAGHPFTLGPTQIRFEQFARTPRGTRADLAVAADAIRISAAWPAPGLRVRVRLDGDRVRGEGSVLLGGEEAVRFAGSHTLARACGQATLTAQQALATLGKRLQPRPPALAPLDLAAGAADANFEVDWCDAKVAAKGTLHLRDARIGWEKAQAQGVQAALQLDGWQPLRGSIQLSATQGQLATGSELANLGLDLALTEDALQIRTLHLDLFGGAVHSAPITLPWPPTGQPLPLAIEQIDLGQLLDVLKVSGLSGSGRLDGVLPFAYRDGALEVRNGRLNSTGGGTLKYAPAQVIADNPGLQALRNLHFQKLDMRLNYASNGAYRTESVLEGSNPDFYDGYPIRFSLNINGELPGLFRSALFSGDFNRHILEQLQSGKLQ